MFRFDVHKKPPFRMYEVLLVFFIPQAYSIFADSMNKYVDFKKISTRLSHWRQITWKYIIIARFTQNSNIVKRLNPMEPLEAKNMTTYRNIVICTELRNICKLANLTMERNISWYQKCI
ncbi:uncharacterized protein LOC129716942 [Wyeomyia smithii]|uniref:uncharacterized protein LOC129716942 n=1 Tax=Wyeomyia smithii TaxID=174621 RepID=UPI0024681182|nr:uncharacterized protein LOC129716942 [Wyeomyia smithii]